MANRKKKMKYALIFAGCLILTALSLLIAKKTSSQTPIIYSTYPGALYSNLDAPQEMCVRGINFTEDLNIYLSGNKIEGFTVLDSRTISLSIPADLYGQEDFYTLSIKRENKGLINRRSNNISLNVEECAFPRISDIWFEQPSNVISELTVKGENFTPESTVLINGSVQTDVVARSDNFIRIRYYFPHLLFNDRLDIQVANGYNSTITSAVKTVNNPAHQITEKLYDNSVEYLKQGYLIAHAFGGYEGQAYTNSKEAFLYNYQKGHRLFEVDFQFTSDNILATLHDREDEIKTFSEEQEDSPYTILDFQSLCELLIEYDDVYIITDTKYHHSYYDSDRVFQEMTSIIDELDEELLNRFIIQVYNQHMYYFAADNYNFSSYIYTLYASGDDDEAVVRFVEETKIPVVTMWNNRATEDFVSALNEKGAVCFAHTVNDIEEINALFDIGVFGIYTDYVTYDELQYRANERYQLFFDK